MYLYKLLQIENTLWWWFVDFELAVIFCGGGFFNSFRIIASTCQPDGELT